MLRDSLLAVQEKTISPFDCQPELPNFVTFDFAGQRVKAGDASACARSMKQQHAIVIEDVMSDEDFAPCQSIAERAGFRSVQSTPLVSSSGAFLGILSTHFPVRHRPTECEMHAVRLLANSAANAIIEQRARIHVKEREAIERGVNRTREVIQRSRALLKRLGSSDFTRLESCAYRIGLRNVGQMCRQGSVTHSADASRPTPTG